MKKCSKCGEERPLSMFSKDKQKKDGLSSHCKTCHHFHYLSVRSKKLKRYRERYTSDIQFKERKHQYNKEYNKKHGWSKNKRSREAAKEEWLELINDRFGKPSCAACGYDVFEVLHFHHFNPQEKGSELSILMLKKPTAKGYAELEKGCFLCPTHHAELHMFGDLGGHTR